MSSSELIRAASYAMLRPNSRLPRTPSRRQSLQDFFSFVFYLLLSIYVPKPHVAMRANSCRYLLLVESSCADLDVKSGSEPLSSDDDRQHSSLVNFSRTPTTATSPGHYILVGKGNFSNVEKETVSVFSSAATAVLFRDNERVN